MTAGAERAYTLDDLPRFSPWPARLLGVEPWTQRTKSPSEVMREYEGEKWGPLRDRMLASRTPVSLDQVEDWAREGVPPSLCSIEDRFELLSPVESRGRYLDLVEAVLARYGPSATLVELGAGYGSVVLALAQRRSFSHAHVVAAEYTSSGEEMLRLVGRAAGIDLTVGHCDFTTQEVVDFAVPRGAIVFTSFAATYVPRLDAAFVEALRRLDPAVVVQFEPCYEHYDTDTTIGLMRRRYVQVNDYNTNLATLLHDAEAAGSIAIVEERRAIFGANALLPASVIAWTVNG